MLALGNKGCMSPICCIAHVYGCLDRGSIFSLDNRLSFYRTMASNVSQFILMPNCDSYGLQVA